MIQALNTKTLVRLRDQMLESGGRKSIAIAGAIPQHPFEGDDEARMFFDAVFEAMFLMIAADGKIEDAERTVLKGALRELTNNMMRSAQIDAHVTELEGLLKAEGQAQRLAKVCSVLAERPEAAEAGFVLAAAAAFADNEIADAENDVLNDLAEKLGISTERAEQLLDQLEQESDG